jgi:hypothetical protein
MHVEAIQELHLVYHLLSSVLNASRDLHSGSNNVDFSVWQWLPL